MNNGAELKSSDASSVVTTIPKAVPWLGYVATKGAERMKQTAASTATTSRKMVQQELPFENFEPGWQGKRYLLCTDGQWHLVLRILPGLVADTQCCEDAHVVLPPPNGTVEPMCSQCTSLHFLGASSK